MQLCGRLQEVYDARKAAQAAMGLSDAALLDDTVDEVARQLYRAGFKVGKSKRLDTRQGGVAAACLLQLRAAVCAAGQSVSGGVRTRVLRTLGCNARRQCAQLTRARSCSPLTSSTRARARARTPYSQQALGAVADGLAVVADTETMASREAANILRQLECAEAALAVTE